MWPFVVAMGRAKCYCDGTSAFVVTIKKQLIALTSALVLICAVVIGFPFANTVPDEVSRYLAPALAAVAVFAMFSMLLKWQVGGNLFADLGFVYLAFGFAYTVIPAFSF